MASAQYCLCVGTCMKRVREGRERGARTLSRLPAGSPRATFCLSRHVARVVAKMTEGRRLIGLLHRRDRPAGHHDFGGRGDAERRSQESSDPALSDRFGAFTPPTRFGSSDLNFLFLAMAGSTTSRSELAAGDPSLNHRWDRCSTSVQPFAATVRRTAARSADVYSLPNRRSQAARLSDLISICQIRRSPFILGGVTSMMRDSTEPDYSVTAPRAATNDSLPAPLQASGARRPPCWSACSYGCPQAQKSELKVARASIRLYKASTPKGAGRPYLPDPAGGPQGGPRDSSPAPPLSGGIRRFASSSPQATPVWSSGRHEWGSLMTKGVGQP